MRNKVIRNLLLGTLVMLSLCCLPTESKASQRKSQGGVTFYGDISVEEKTEESEVLESLPYTESSYVSSKPSGNFFLPKTNEKIGRIEIFAGLILLLLGIVLMQRRYRKNKLE